MPVPRGRNLTTRQHILEVADRLFTARGCRAVGMDEIVREADVGKMTLYRQFPTKDDLIVAVLEGCSGRAVDALAEAASSKDAWSGLLRVVETVADEIREPTFRGCPFQNAMAEFRDDHPVHDVVARHQSTMLQLLTRLAREAGCEAPSQLAEELLVLLNGAYATARVLDRKVARRRLLSLADATLERWKTTPV
jgi:AcrR family transcriptional regulator